MKLSESQLLEYRLQMESLICEREAMISVNKEREHHGFSLGYNEEDFFNLGDKFKEIHSRMIHLMEGP